MFNQSRRKLLKGLLYGSALSVGGLATLVLSENKHANASLSANANLEMNNISVIQQQSPDKEIVTLTNQSDEVISLDSDLPISLQQFDGSLIVKANQATDGGLLLQAGERVTIELETVSANIIDNALLIPDLLPGHLMMSSEHSSFNRIIPMTMV